MIKTGRVKPGESRCTCGGRIIASKNGVHTCGNTACKSAAPRTLRKEAKSGK